MIEDAKTSICEDTMQNLIAESRGISTNITGFITPVEYIVLQANKPVEYQENIPEGVNHFFYFLFFI